MHTTSSAPSTAARQDGAAPAATRRVRVLMVTGAYPTPERPHWGTFIQSQVESLIEAGVEVHVVHPRRGSVARRYAQAVAQVWWATLTRRCDLIHGHYGLWCLVARMQWRVPVVASFLGDDVLGTPTRQGTLSRKSLLVVAVSRWLTRHVDAVIVKSEEMRARLRGQPAYVIPNGVDFALFRPRPRAQTRSELGWEVEGVYFLFGNNPRIPRKDYPLAEAAVARLRARGIPARLVVANGLPQATVAQHLNAANALLLTLLHEGSPNIVKEAMACGVPVVATAAGDTRELIGRTAGCAVCLRDPDALADGLERALHSPVPTTGREDIAHLERSVVAREVITVYERVLANRGRDATRPHVGADATSHLTSSSGAGEGEPNGR